MKKYILAMLVLFTFSALSFGQNSRKMKKEVLKETNKVEAQTSEKAQETFKGDPENPITFKTTNIENKGLAYGEDFLFSFEFTNTGVDSLEISGVRTSCGCTEAKKPLKPLAPGESSVIAVTYDTKRVGAFVKSITVVTNKTEPIILTIKGEVANKPE